MKKIFEKKKIKNIIMSVIILVLFVLIFSIKDYIPLPNQFYRTGNMKMPREGHKAVLLQDGRVLIIGGTINSKGNSTNTVEFYNPEKKKFILTDTLKENLREGYAVTLLNNGRVLISGGVKYTNINGKGIPEVVSTLQIYNPITDKFTIVGHMKMPRKNHTATLLPNGQVLIIGGEPKTIKNAELFDPKTNKTKNIGKTIYSYYRPSTILTKDGVLIIGSFNPQLKNITNEAEIYNFKRNKFISVGKLNNARIAPVLVLLKNGDVLISGGVWGKKGKNSIEIYNHNTKIINTIGRIKRYNGFSVVVLENGNVLFTGGDGPGLDISYYKTAEVYDVNLKTFNATRDMKQARSGHTSILLNDGKILITGGYNGQVLKSSELYNCKY